ncbi:MAG TPA: head-tail connector protein [Candidatus Paceibacterota bacterium]|nr:head-tail connector protein [Candidatus Paceibacterota bacterium]
MALGADYLTREELKAYMSLEGDDQDDNVDEAISSASREIERHCHRQFNDSEAVTTRVYKAKRCDEIAVDDFWTTDGFKLEVDTMGDGTGWTEVPASDYQLSPLNRMRDGVDWVYWKIEMVGNTSLPVSRRACVRVTAQWGWETLPKDVKQAVKMLASDTFQVKDSRMGVAGSDQFGTIVRVRSNSLVEAKLKHFVREKVLVA